jgi:hypothetical protein
LLIAAMVDPPSRRGSHFRVMSLRHLMGACTSLIQATTASGAWVRPQPNVLRVAGTPVTWWLQMAAAIKAVTDPDTNPRNRVAAMSFHSAAKALGFEREAKDDQFAITVTGTTLPELWNVTVHRSKQLDRCDITDVGGLPCTTAARMGIDLASVQPDRMEVVSMIDDLVGGKHAGRGWLHSTATRLAAGRRNGSYVACITAPDAGAEFRSWLERHGATVYRKGGLPEPRWNVRVPLEGRRYALVDSLFEPYRVVSELDGPRFHDPPGQRRKDKGRDRLLGIKGYLVLRFDYWDVVKTPELVVEQIRKALVSRGLVG